MMKSFLDWLRKLHRQSPLFRGVVQVIPWIGPVLQEYLDVEDSGPGSYDDLKEICSQIDAQLLKSVGDFVAGPGRNTLDAKVPIRSYQWQMKAALDDHNLTREGLLQRLQQREVLESMTDTIPRPDLVIDIQEGNKTVVFTPRGEESLTVNDAELLWDCSCNEDAILDDREPEDATDPLDECPIHNGSRAAEAVDHAFSNGLVEIKYDGTSVLWTQNPQFWPPSIDAFHFAEDLRSDGVYDDSSISRVLDLGCGTGFLGQRLASLNQSVNHITYADWLLTPVAYSALNWCRQGEVDTRTSIDLRVGIGVEQTNLTGRSWSLTQEKPYDMVVCNPPYLPLPEPIQDDAQTIPVESTVSGTALLQNVIHNAGDLANQLYVAFSNIALPEAKKAVGEVGLSLERVGPERSVPFRVSIALQNRDYVEWLLDERNLKYHEGRRHRLWHSVATYAVK